MNEITQMFRPIIRGLLKKLVAAKVPAQVRELTNDGIDLLDLSAVSFTKAGKYRSEAAKTAVLDAFEDFVSSGADILGSRPVA
jgi:hypothetical protein